MATMLVVHGAWAAGWFWRKMRPLLREFGHDLITPTMTGLGERSHLAHQDVDLETHVSDIVQVLDFEDLHEVVLVGHSYDGSVDSSACRTALHGACDRSCIHLLGHAHIAYRMLRDLGVDIDALRASRSVRLTFDGVAVHLPGLPQPV